MGSHSGFRKPRQGEQGYVMLLCMVMMAALSISVVSLYVQAERTRFTASTVAGQYLAALRAEQAAQTALARLETAVLTVPTAQTARVAPTAVQLADESAGGWRDQNCFNSASAISSGGYDINADGLGITHTTGTGSDLLSGGGMISRYCAYFECIDNGAGGCVQLPYNFVTVIAEGFYGSTETSPNFAESIIKVEVTIGTGSAGASVNTCSSYDCT